MPLSKARRKPKLPGGAGKDEPLSWDTPKRCTLGDLCADDKKKISNVIAKVVSLNAENERMEDELATFRDESERLRKENMELHKLNSSLQTRLMQALVLTKTYQDQIKLRKRTFTVETQTTSAQGTSGANPTILDFSSRGERTGVAPLRSGRDGEAAASAPGDSRRETKEEDLAKTTYKDRTLYFESKSGTRKVHAFDARGKENAPSRAERKRKEKEFFTMAEEFLSTAHVSEELEDIIDVINAAPA